MNPSNDGRPRPPAPSVYVRSAETALRVEDAACRRALRAAGVNVGTVLAHYGSAAKFPRLTFAMLAGAVDFPSRPSVSGEEPDSPHQLLCKFVKSALWREWVAAWDARPDVRTDRRELVMRGVGWDMVVVRAAAAAEASGRPRLLVGPPDGPRLAVCTFHDWLQDVGWVQSGGDLEDS